MPRIYLTEKQERKQQNYTGETIYHAYLFLHIYLQSRLDTPLKSITYQCKSVDFNLFLLFTNLMGDKWSCSGAQSLPLLLRSILPYAK